MRQHETSQSTTYLLSPPVLQLLARNRERGHVHVLSAYRRGLGATPRHELNLLWHIDAAAALLTVQARDAPVWPGKLGEAQKSTTVNAPAAGELVQLVVHRSCQKTPPSRTPEPLRAELERKGPDGKKLLGKAYRSRLVIVPEEERTTWAIGRLQAIGLEPLPDAVEVGKLSYAALGGRKTGIPYVEIRARARVIDPNLFADALRQGTGKGRNYGLGLIRLQPAS
ncbi:type I-E CRISPR-associated protein Cas6/Cse3/CasE [Tessaracoccus caeni]|uniref:type I-E CRISPR-associated protein Cas6/Cse3/CasE n=1 Tax=Tessaracoccus caeni TaxID=3031239 RepID=UPI0023DCAEA4|nr:type I-E CRISPR-associated protein Cas6/Cse3/CasE [Tessaracoccus caeni]MDF1489855.1 type I-E CRISPR-associated protein Cas6/Cse3/CasE [Tessaracoccus caeni]